MIRLFALLVSLFAAPVLASPAETNALVAKVDALAKERAALVAKRDAESAAYGRQIAEIGELKARQSSWARDRRLQSLLATARDGAAQLAVRERELRDKEAALAAARKQALAAIDAELAAAPAEPRRADLLAQRPRCVGPSARPIRVPDESIDPLDGPEDLEQKAAALAEAEAKLLVERNRLARRADALKKQARLARAKQRAEAPDLLADDGPRRTPAPTGSRGNGFESPTQAEDQGDVPSPAPPGAPPPTGSIDSGADPTIVLSDVVDPAALAELRRAEGSGDLQSRAAAAEIAGKSLDARLAKLRARRLEMENRAKALRGP